MPLLAAYPSGLRPTGAMSSACGSGKKYKHCGKTTLHQLRMLQQSSERCAKGRVCAGATVQAIRQATASGESKISTLISLRPPLKSGPRSTGPPALIFCAVKYWCHDHAVAIMEHQMGHALKNSISENMHGVLECTFVDYANRLRANYPRVHNP